MGFAANLILQPTHCPCFDLSWDVSPLGLVERRQILEWHARSAHVNLWTAVLHREYLASFILRTSGTHLPGPSSAMDHISVNSTEKAAPLLIGYILNWGLYGSLCVQLYYYCVAFPKDRPVLKLLVYGLFLIETAQSLIIAHDLIAIFATQYGNFRALNDPEFTWLNAPVMTGIVSCTVQIYFAYRIRIVSGSKIAGIIIVLLALTQGISAIISGVQASETNDLTRLQIRAHVSTTIWLIGSAVCDIIIATFMVYSLSQRRANAFKATQALITRIIRLTIETGSLTATIAIINVALFLAPPGTAFHVTPALVLGKLYTNTLIATLNNRLHIVDHTNGDLVVTNSTRTESEEVSGNLTQRIRISQADAYTSRNNTIVTVNIEREIWTGDINMSDANDAENGKGKIRTIDETS